MRVMHVLRAWRGDRQIVYSVNVFGKKNVYRVQNVAHCRNALRRCPLSYGSMGTVRDTKKRETRQRISDVATEMFFARGFDAVTVDEIAAAANVSKMTVFNYFARKEELMLDLEDELTLQPFRQAVRERSDAQSPIDALRALLPRMRDNKSPLLYMSRRAVSWWEVVNASPTLKSRLHELSDEAAERLAQELAGPNPGGASRLAAGLIVLSVRTAREEAVRLFGRGSSAKKANAAFFQLVESGLTSAELLLHDPAAHI